MWRDAVTDRSWSLLQKLRSKFSFTLIGGWGVYMYTKGLKSKDVDIVVDYGVLERLNAEYSLVKNSRLKKYEFTVEGIDVDTYVPYFSDLGLPPETLMSETKQVEGFNLPPPEALLATKQRAEADRRGSEKGFKDRVDIISLLMLPDIDMKRYAKLVVEHDLQGYVPWLEGVVARAGREFEELGVTDARKAKLLRKRLLAKAGEARRLTRP